MSKPQQKWEEKCSDAQVQGFTGLQTFKLNIVSSQHLKSYTVFRVVDEKSEEKMVL